MKPNENLDILFAKYAPTGAVLLDYIKRLDEYIVLYRDDGDTITPYVVHQLNDSGLHYGCYYADGWTAWQELHSLRGRNYTR